MARGRICTGWPRVVGAELGTSPFCLLARQAKGVLQPRFTHINTYQQFPLRCGYMTVCVRGFTCVLTSTLSGELGCWVKGQLQQSGSWFTARLQVNDGCLGWERPLQFYRQHFLLIDPLSLSASDKLSLSWIMMTALFLYCERFLAQKMNMCVLLYLCDEPAKYIYVNFCTFRHICTLHTHLNIISIIIISF